MELIFSNNEKVDLCIKDNDLGQMYHKIYKNLRHAPLEFRKWDNPFYLDLVTHEQLIADLEFYAAKVEVVIDRTRALAQDQVYFNKLHKIYELNYNGHFQWLDFHEHIHLCEKDYKLRPKILDIDYREKAGMLIQPFNLNWLKESTTLIRKGDVFVSWAELGKTPYVYWRNNEPDDFERLCALAKPWLNLRPKIKIAFEDFDLLRNIDQEKFNLWWIKYETDWCRHWNLTYWTIEDMFANAVLGRVSDPETIKWLLKNNAQPIGIATA